MSLTLINELAAVGARAPIYPHNSVSLSYTETICPACEANHTKLKHAEAAECRCGLRMQVYGALMFIWVRGMTPKKAEDLRTLIQVRDEQEAAQRQIDLGCLTCALDLEPEFAHTCRKGNNQTTKEQQ